MTLVCLMLITFDKKIASILYAKKFFDAWEYVPILLIATLFGALSGHIGGIFSAVKDTKAYATSTIAGAICNIILNLLLIKQFGAMGAALATLAANILVWTLRYKKAAKYIKMNVRLFNCMISYFLLMIQSLVLYIVNNDYVVYVSGVIIFAFTMIIYRPEVMICIRMMNIGIKKVKESKKGEE